MQKILLLKKNINAIYKITTCTLIDVKKNITVTVHVHGTLVSIFFLNYSEYVQYDIAIELTAKKNFDLSNFHHDFKRS